MTSSGETIKNVIKEHEGKIHISHHGNDGDKIAHIVNHYNSLAQNALNGTRAYHEDLITWLRAIEMLLGGILSAQTHREKDIRIRGLVDTIQSIINKARRLDENYWYGTGEFPDFFQCDHPVREIYQRKNELAEKLNKISSELSDINPDDYGSAMKHTLNAIKSILER